MSVAANSRTFCPKLPHAGGRKNKWPAEGTGHCGTEKKTALKNWWEGATAKSLPGTYTRMADGDASALLPVLHVHVCFQHRKRSRVHFKASCCRCVTHSHGATASAAPHP
jgi:hypothetical protein